MSTTSDGGGNIFEDALNIALQTSTMGLLGYSKTGVGAGLTGSKAVDLTKEVTGAKAAEDANKIARQQFEEQQAAAEAQRNAAVKQNQQNQIKQSQLAGSLRVAPVKTSTTGSFALGGDQRDFLGL